MEKKIKLVIFYSYNIIRILFSIFILFVCFSELYNIGKDPLTYEKVYTGEFLGGYGFESLCKLKLFRIFEGFSFLIYLLLVVFHLTIFRKNNIITCLLRISDIFIIIYFTYIIYSIYFV